ncbi:MAG: tRNA lysidine(34) synthetase TilS [Eubacteriales bacterium]|nr:tRNA lysidine(34) synthetase TilS [Eubacteriales bacterium]
MTSHNRAPISRNHKTLLERVQQTILHEQLIPEGTGVLVAVSGGPDSMALLDILRRLGVCPLRVAHLNHQLRPGDCDLDEALIRDYCRKYDLPCDIGQMNVAQLSLDTCQGIEATGRDARYQFFANCLARWQAEPNPPTEYRIALAHHLDDQAETVLLHLGRGSGLDGLVGMLPRSGQLIRPLLTIRRAELRNDLIENAVTWRQDHTNDELFTLRNRLRHQVLPQWQQALGYDPATILARSAELARADQVLLAQLTEQAWQRVVKPLDILRDLRPTPTSPLRTQIAFATADFCREPQALQNRLLRQAWRMVSGQSKDIEWRHLKIARDFIVEPGRKRGHLDWPLGIVIDIDQQNVVFSRP